MKKKILAVTIATALMVSCFTSCDNNTSSDSQVSQAESSTTVSADSTSSATDISSASDSKTSDSDKQLTADDMFSDRDLSGDYSECTDITLSDSTASCSNSSVTVADGSVTITKAGTYKFSGTFTGQIVVDPQATATRYSWCLITQALPKREVRRFIL